MKTFREYLNACSFDDVWPEIRDVFGEPEEIRPVYADYFEKLKVLPARKQTAGTIDLAPVDKDNAAIPPAGIDGAPDYLIEKPVRHVRDTNEKVAAALLYWSSIISFRTSKEHDDDLFEWLRLTEEDNPQALGQYLMKSVGPHPYEDLKIDSLWKKRERFWGDTTTKSSVTCWHGILNVLKRKLQMNLIFQRGYADHAGRERDAEKMELCCRLIDIATSEIDIHFAPRSQRALHLLFKILEENIWRWDD